MQSRHPPFRLRCEPLEDRCTPSGLGGHDLIETGPPAGHESDLNAHALVRSASDEAGPRSVYGEVLAAANLTDPGSRLVWGESAIVDGARIVTWAVVSADNEVLAAGVTFSQKLAEDMPESGDGPAGAIASLEFPAIVQETTFFNHLEIQPEPDGHVSPPGSNGTVYSVPHFDFHFYGIPEEEVLGIPAQNPPLPPAYELPAGYLPAGPSIAEMGRHSSPRSILSVDKLSTVMILGYLPDGSQMHFVEPMISQEVLLSQQDFSLDVPMLTTFGREMLYPTQFEATFQGNSWSFVFSEFVTVQ
jgi:hypothetical protein